MLLEIAEIDIRPGGADAFEKAMKEGAIADLAACDGVVSVQLGRGVESRSRFTFLVVWTSMEAHDAARRLESFERFRHAFGDLAIGGSMHHYEMDDPVVGASG